MTSVVYAVGFLSLVIGSCCVLLGMRLADKVPMKPLRPRR